MYKLDKKPMWKLVAVIVVALLIVYLCQKESYWNPNHQDEVADMKKRKQDNIVQGASIGASQHIGPRDLQHIALTGM